MKVAFLDDDLVETYVVDIPDGCEKDLRNWLEWAEKQNERNKKYEEAQNDL